MTQTDLSALVGSELGVSRWIEMSQDRIDRFAACTEDHQWIHVDPERAAAGPFGATIAHGYLTLSLVAATLGEIVDGRTGSGMVLNYGIDRLRFLAPVKSGSRVRNRVVLDSIEPRPNGTTLYGFVCTIEIDGEEKPALVATVLGMAAG
jgi:acyl dehydratase